MAANPAIEIDIDNPDPLDCPTTFAENIALLRQLIHAELVGEYIPYVTGAATPDVDDQDKVWHRFDANGRPIGTYVFYSGAWRREYVVPLGTIVMYSGDPAVDFAGAGGLGTVGGEWDGFALCNGNNGTDDLSDKFIVGAKMSDLAVGYPAGAGPWKTTVTGAATQSGAGVHEVTLNNDTTYRPARDAVQVRRWEADGNTPNVAGSLYGVGTSVDLLGADAGNTDPDAIPTLPPWFAYALVKFIGFA